MTPPVTLHVLDAGIIECGDFALFSPDLESGVARTMTCRSYLVEHPDGLLVWDTGLPDAYADEPEGVAMGEVFRFYMRRTLEEQLDALGVPPSRVDVLALSHLHIDHVGNLGLFADAEVIVQRAERDAAWGPDPAAHQYFPETFAALDPEALKVVDGDHDVFGDGTVVLKAWPGHSPGHQGLSVTLPDAGVVVLGADLAHTVPNFEREIVSSLNSDHDQSIASIREAKAYVTETGASLWLNHDVAQQDGIALTPARHT